MQTYRLIAHPALPARRVSGVQVRGRYLDTGELLLRWRIDGANDVILAPEVVPARTDELWKTTCFEVFVDLGGGAYREFNFSPSGQWAAYDFSSCRVASGNPDLPETPSIEVDRGNSIVAGVVRVPATALEGAGKASLCAVIEEEGGVLSFWSNAHTRERPDFHDRSCFTLDLDSFAGRDFQAAR